MGMSLAASVAERFGAGPRLRQIDPSRWAAQTDPVAPVIEVWVSTSYLVTISLDGGHERLSVNRTSMEERRRMGRRDHLGRPDAAQGRVRPR